MSTTFSLSLDWRADWLAIARSYGLQ
jgi:hypothetical protein